MTALHAALLDVSIQTHAYIHTQAHRHTPRHAPVHLGFSRLERLEVNIKIVCLLNSRREAGGGGGKKFLGTASGFFLRNQPPEGVGAGTCFNFHSGRGGGGAPPWTPSPPPLAPLPPSPLSSSAPENLGFGNIF